MYQFKDAASKLCNVPFINKRLALVFGLCASSAFFPRTTLEDFIRMEAPIAKVSLLSNIGPQFQGAAPGVVVASPSTGVEPDPDYVYTWTRDSSLVFKLLIDQYIRGSDATLEPLIRDFIISEAQIQLIENPSGNISSGGLGEPKYNIDLTAFTNPWGRPQRDGPALRSISAITFANHLISGDNTTRAYINDTIWPMVELDLKYVAESWNYSTFDLWEEVSSSSFYTSVVQHRALREGLHLGTQLQRLDARSAKKLGEQADMLLCFIQTYWNPLGKYATANTGGGRSGIDANTVLASIHTFDADAGCSAETFQPCSDRALSNLKVYVDSFRDEYTINAGIPSSHAVATGRYKEDFYFGGNPWYLTTAACAEQLYDAIIVWKKQGYIDVTPLSLSFFNQFHPSLQSGHYSAQTSTYKKLLSLVKVHADQFMAIVMAYTPKDGSLAEQFGRANGRPLSAKRLTWSYASILTSLAAREGKHQPTWGAKLSPLGGCKQKVEKMVPVTFRVKAETIPGESIYLTGSAGALKQWSTEDALQLSADEYPIWIITVALSENSKVEYKYIRKRDGKDTVVWMSDPNNLVTPKGEKMSIDDHWR